jgi:transcriptional regulator with XRE-family HTH domain
LKKLQRYNFGEKLRTVRERKGLTLKEVAGHAGVSESLVSQIERNRVSPSVDTLLKLADVLDIDYEHLFSEYRQKRKVTILRAAERGAIHQKQVVIQQLSKNSGDTNAPAIEAYLLELDKDGAQGNREYGHPGWEFGVILSGQAELTYGNEFYTLKAGDSVAFPSSVPHIFRNCGKDTLRAIWVVTPPRQLF